MLNSPRSFRKKDEKISLHWWEKIKLLFFGQWLQSRKPIDSNETQGGMDIPCDLLVIDQWENAIEILAFLVQSIRRNLEIKNNREIDLDVLGASIYLFHIDKMLVKIREYLKTVRTQESDMMQISSLNLMRKQIYEVGNQCYQRILFITSLIQQLPIKKVYTDQFIDQVHALELEISALGSAIRTLNQNTYKTKTLWRLASIEQDLLQALQARHFQQASPFPASSQLNMLHTHDEYLRTKVTSIHDLQTQTFMNGMIDIYQMLKKCYALTRKSVIKQSIDKMAQHIECLIDIMSQNELNKNQAFYHFNQLFHCVESLRFSINSNLRGQKNLFDKSKMANLHLRKLFQKNPLGLEYLKAYSIKRPTLLKPR